MGWLRGPRAVRPGATGPGTFGAAGVRFYRCRVHLSTLAAMTHMICSGIHHARRPAVLRPFPDDTRLRRAGHVELAARVLSLPILSEQPPRALAQGQRAGRLRLAHCPWARPPAPGPVSRSEWERPPCRDSPSRGGTRSHLGSPIAGWNPLPPWAKRRDDLPRPLLGTGNGVGSADPGSCDPGLQTLAPSAP